MENWAVEFTNISRADGSALLAIGETIFQTGVYGPAEISLSKELYDKAVLEVTYRPKVGQLGLPEKLKEAHIKHAVEAAVMTDIHPRTCISVTLQEIQDDGKSLACSINSAILALVDAGLSMKFMVAAVTSGLCSDGEICMFPDKKKQMECRCLLTFSFESQKKEIVDIATSGCYTEQEFDKCLNACKLMSEDIFSFYRDSIKKRYRKN